MKKGSGDTQKSGGKPPTPCFIFWLALFLPGAGHAWMGQAMRGLTFIFFIIMLFWVGIRLFPEFSFIGKHLGGIFIWGLSVIDAYKIARIAVAELEYAPPPKSGDQ